MAALVQDAVDEQRRRPAHLSRVEAALDVATDPRVHGGALPVGVERGGVETEEGGVTAQVLLRERALTMEEQVAHLPEAPLPRRGLRPPPTRRGRADGSPSTGSGGRRSARCRPPRAARYAGSPRTRLASMDTRSRRTR